MVLFNDQCLLYLSHIRDKISLTTYRYFTPPSLHLQETYIRFEIIYHDSLKIFYLKKL